MALRTDNGGEYTSREFENYLASSGIRHEPGPPHSPQLNGVAERTNRTINNMIRSALFDGRVPKSFWADALCHVFHAYNAYPCKTPAGFRSPQSILGLPTIDVKNLHQFGCMAWYKVPEASRKKLDAKARSSILLSYLPNGSGFRLWDLEKKSVVKSCDVIFDNSSFPYGAKLSSSPPPVQVEISWPPSVSRVPSPPASPANSWKHLPLLDVPLQPRGDRLNPCRAGASCRRSA
jgi:hypothetical protein